MILDTRVKKPSPATTAQSFARVVALVLIGLIVLANNATTPAECKVPTEQMNQFCLDLIYP
jgi:hypothetical protein